MATRGYLARLPGRRAYVMETYPKGCARPEGYVDWHDWAYAQAQHGLRQEQQPCGHYVFPQEVAKHNPCADPVNKHYDPGRCGWNGCVKRLGHGGNHAA